MASVSSPKALSGMFKEDVNHEKETLHDARDVNHIFLLLPHYA